MKNPDLSQEHAEEYVRQRQVNPLLQQEQLQHQRNLTNIAEEEQRYIRAYGTGTLSEPQFQDQSIDLTKKRRVIQDVVSRVNIGKDTVGLKNENRHSEDVIRLFESVFRLPIPKPRKERLIVQRDKLGRIVHSKSPTVASSLRADKAV